MKLFLKSSRNFCSAGSLACLSLLASAPLSSAAIVQDFFMTPNVVETEALGRLEFLNGIPKPDTVQKVLDNLDLARGILAFLDGVRMTSANAILRGMRDSGIEPGEVAICDNLPDALSGIPTSKTTTIYALSQINLNDGPVVMDAPSGVQGMINDVGFRHVADIGQADPDLGGKYLFLPPEYAGSIPDGFYVFRSATFDNWLTLSASIEDDDWESSVVKLRAGLNIYPLAMAGNPPEEIFHNLLGKKFNVVQSSDFDFFKDLNAVIQKEPSDAFSPELNSKFAMIGISKGRPFEPDERMARILTEAAVIGNATALSIKHHRLRGNTWEDVDRTY